MLRRRLQTRPELVVLPNSATPADRSVEKRKIRKHHILNVIRESGPLSRADISKASGYNLPSVSSLVDELVRDQLVTEAEALQTRRGRRPVPVSLNARAAMVMGIDLGRRTTLGMMLDLEGKVIHRLARPTRSGTEDKERMATWVLDFMDEFVKSSSDIKLPPLAGIGVALPGLIQIRRRMGYDPHSMAAAVRDALGGEISVPVLVDNDARMMALGSLWFGTGRRYSNFAILNVGDHLGLGVVLDNRVYQGAYGYAGELGQIPMGDEGVVTPDGIVGGLENVVSGAGLERMAAAAGLGTRTVEQLAELARGGDRRAVQIFEKFSERLARAIAVVATLFNPEAIIIAGYVAHVEDVFHDHVQKVLPRYLLPRLQEATQILVSEQREADTPLGAGATILHHIFSAAHIQLDEVL